MYPDSTIHAKISICDAILPQMSEWQCHSKAFQPPAPFFGMRASLCSVPGCQTQWAEEYNQVKINLFLSPLFCFLTECWGLLWVRLCVWVVAEVRQVSAEQQADCGTGGVSWLITWNSFKQVTYAYFHSALTQILILLMELSGVITNYACNDTSF